MIYIDGDKTLIIKDNVQNIFNRYEQKKGKNESGGILLGKIYLDRVEITDVTTPGYLDRFGPFHYIRSKLTAQKKINKVWNNSQGSLIYLGEWHTHQEKSPSPSGQDMKMIQKALVKTDMEINFLYLIIVGQDGTFWIGKQTNQGLNRLFKKD